jgi:hypothetical protein
VKDLLAFEPFREVERGIFELDDASRNARTSAGGRNREGYGDVNELLDRFKVRRSNLCTNSSSNRCEMAGESSDGGADGSKYSEAGASGSTLKFVMLDSCIPEDSAKETVAFKIKDAIVESERCRLLEAVNDDSLCSATPSQNWITLKGKQRHTSRERVEPALHDL